MSSLDRFGMLSGATIALLVIASVWFSQDACSEADLIGEYSAMGLSGPMLLKLESARRGVLSSTSFRGQVNFEWEFETGSDHLLLHFPGPLAETFEDQLQRRQFRPLNKYPFVYVGLSASCRLGQRRLYIDSDVNSYFREK